MRSSQVAFLRSALALGALTAAADVGRAAVIVVDASGAGQYTNLQVAVLAAAEGDTLLVKPGAYSSFTLDAKALSIVADAGPPVTVFGSVTVKNLATGQVVVLGNLKVTGATTTATTDAPGVGLALTNNAGFVRAQGCIFEGAKGWGDGLTGGGECCDLPNHHWGWDGVVANGNQGGIAFVGSTLRGGRGANAYIWCYCGNGGVGGDGLRASDSLVALYDCTLEGGRGESNGYGGGTGGAGGQITTSGASSAMHASGTSFRGGNGGEGYDYIASEGGAGGHGLVLGATAVAWTLENTFQGGAGGAACGGLFGYGPEGLPTAISGSLFPFNVPKLQMSMPAVVREGIEFPLTVQGRPGDPVYLFVARKTQFAMLPSWRGVRLTKNVQPEKIAILGPIPASGVLTTNLAFPEQGLGVASAQYFLQTFRVSPIDGVALGSFAALTVLDSAY